MRSLSRRLQRLIAADKPPLPSAPQDPEKAAQAAQLRYVSDDEPGIRRIAVGRGFRYQTADGKPLRASEDLGRIRALAIPPAWTQVWICPRADGHIQAVGRDVRGRKQYRYHARFREIRDRTKFGRMIAFARALPRIRKAVQAHLAMSGLPRERVLATVVRLLEETGIRVGCDEYARTNGHFGLSTLQDKHVSVRGPELRFSFRGKSGKEHVIGLRDPRLARLVRACQELPGQRLFQYVDDSGEQRPIGSQDVNEYLRAVSGSDFTAKDFRTWAGTVCVAETLAACAAPASASAAKRELLRALDLAASRLGNTRAVCRSSYVHPEVMDAFSEGRMKAAPARVTNRKGLSPAESATLRLLEAASRRSR